MLLVCVGARGDAVKDAGATQSLLHTSGPVNRKVMTIVSEPQALNGHQIT